MHRGQSRYFQARSSEPEQRLWVLDLCPADFNNSGSITVDDVFGFIQSYLRSEDLADTNSDGLNSVDDVFGWLSAYFTGCPD